MTPWAGIQTARFLLSDASAVAGKALLSEALAWARALEDAGVGAREPVGIHAPNGLSALAAIVAVRLVGACAVPMHPRWTASERDAAAARLGCRLVLSSAGNSRNGAALPAFGRPLQVPTLAGSRRAVAGDYAVHTSGTEGTPKAVLLTEEALRLHGQASARRLGDAEGDRWLASLSWAHVGGLAMLARVLHAGRDLVVPPAALPVDLGPTVGQQGVTHLSLVPTQLARWLDADPDGAPPTCLRLVLVGGAATPMSIQGRAVRRGWPVRLTYGLTEASSQVATADASTPGGSVGNPLAGIDVRLVDEQGRDMGPADAGRVVVRAPWLMQGYHGDEPATRRRIRDGWLWTDDLAHRDGAGNLWIVGRLGDRIVTGGEKVDPMEVESVLADHPAVAEACVVGVSDPVWGERVVAAVVLRHGATLAPGELRTFAAGRLAPFKCPRQEVVVPSLPRSAAGKLLRRQVQTSLAAPTPT